VAQAVALTWHQPTETEGENEKGRLHTACRHWTFGQWFLWASWRCS